MFVVLVLTWCTAAGDCRDQRLADIPMASCMVQAEQIAADQQTKNLWLVNRRLAGWKCQIGNRVQGGA